jgi:hypothetical protein
MSDGNKKRDWCLSPYIIGFETLWKSSKSKSQRNIIKEIKDQNIKLIDSYNQPVFKHVWLGKVSDSKGRGWKYTRAGMTITNSDLVNITEAKHMTATA